MGCCNDGASVHPDFTQRKLDLQSSPKEILGCSSVLMLPENTYSLLGLFTYASNMKLGNIFCMQVWEKENCCTICCRAVDMATQLYCLTPGAQLFTILVQFLHFLL